MRLTPWYLLPYTHTGAEQCFVVEGSISAMDQTLTSGDFLRTKAGAEHGDIISLKWRNGALSCCSSRLSQICLENNGIFCHPSLFEIDEEIANPIFFL
jgi:hypothetical protein